MTHERTRLATALLVASDLLATSIALWAAHEARVQLAAPGLDWLGPVFPFSDYVPLLALILPIWLFVFHASGLYGPRASLSLRPEIARLVPAVAVAALLLAAAMVGLRLYYVSRTVVASFVVLDLLLVVAGRTVVRMITVDTTTRRHVVVAGQRDGVMQTAASMSAHGDWGIHLVGVVSDGTWTLPPQAPYRLLGTVDDLPELATLHDIDEVIVVPASGPMDQLDSLTPLFERLERQGVVMRLLVNFLPAPSDLSLERLGDLPLLTFSPAPSNETRLFFRRVADVVLAFVLAAVLSPLFAVIAAAIKLTSRGPVLFRQTRCGLHGRPFTFLKFRSMYPGAEALKPALRAFNEMDGPAFKMSDDPRVTPIGRLLRKTSLDELPQLWNILKGDMSFVGPRPAVLDEVAQYEPWQWRRLSMKPGLTCLWQVSGRSELTFDEWMRLDLEYIDNWSLWLDLKIALRTIPAVLFGRGAK